MQQKGRPYTVEKWSPTWAKRYEKEKRIISSIFGNVSLQIEHIGSTSIPGIWAKPQIDILVIVNDFTQVDRLIDSMIATGYNYQKDFEGFNERYFTRDLPSGERTVSVHVRTKDNPQTLSAIYFRDYLRSHDKERDLYSEIKLRAYDGGKTDRAAYPAGKKAILAQLLERAKKWYELKTSDRGASD